MDQLRAAYQRDVDINRHTATVQNVNVVVTTSDKLEREVHEIIDGILTH